MMQEISASEYQAWTLALDKTRLRKRLNEAKSVLEDQFRAMFKPGIFKPARTRAVFRCSIRLSACLDY